MTRLPKQVLEEILKDAHMRHTRREYKLTGFRKYYGFLHKGYRFEVKVPTTIYDRQVAIIRAYAYEKRKKENRTYKKEVVVEELILKLENMPVWNTELQTLMLKRYDESKLKRKVDALVKKLPELEY